MSDQRRVWSKPKLSRLEAGRAEANPSGSKNDPGGPKGQGFRS